MKAQLKTHLLNNETVDLYELFHQLQPISIYEVINQLHQLDRKSVV